MITVFIGGASSGKSRLAEEAAQRLAGPVTYVATWCRPGQGPGSGAPDPAGPDLDMPDPDMEARIARHRERRPSSWGLREVGPGEPLGAVLAGIEGPVLVDALGTWVAHTPGFAVDVAGLCRVLVERSADTLIVSEEVGMGVHPETGIGRDFRSALGGLNQAVAAVADQAWLVVAGRLLALHGSGTAP